MFKPGDSAKVISEGSNQGETVFILSASDDCDLVVTDIGCFDKGELGVLK